MQEIARERRPEKEAARKNLQTIYGCGMERVTTIYCEALPYFLLVCQHLPFVILYGLLRRFFGKGGID